MKRIIGLLVFFVVINFGVSAQKGFAPMEKIKLQEANTAFYANYYEEAIMLYKSLYNKHMGSSLLNSKLGFCYLYLGDYQDALDYFDAVSGEGLKAKDADYYFGHGLAYQKVGKYEEALVKYKEFQQKGRGKDLIYFGVDDKVLQCDFALIVKETPVSATLENLGDSVNSSFDDYHPSLSADGKTFIFTSRREDSKGGIQLDDGQYYEDVYESKWNGLEDDWGESKPVEGALNTEEYDANCSVSPDGQSILVYRNVTSENKKIISPTGGGDIYLSKLGATGRWSAPKLVDGVNSTAMDAGACLSSDGSTMYFISNRSGVVGGRGAQGGKDIWVSTKEEDGTWGKPTNIGEDINTNGDESSVFIHPNGKTLFFSSEGHPDKNMGGFDVFRSDFKDGKWSIPENLGFPINSHRDEKEIIVSTDGQVGWLTSRRGIDKKDFDIYELDLKHYNVFTGESEVLSILKGKVIDSSTGLPMEAKIEVKEQGSDVVVSLTSNKDGSYFNSFVSHKTYEITVNHKGYKPFATKLTLSAPKPKVVKKRRTTSSRKKKKKTTKTHAVTLNLEIQRNDSIEVISKDLFTTQVIVFNSNEDGYVINDFSKNLIAMFARQQIKAPAIVLEVSGHFHATEEANMESKKLADQVVAELKKNEVETKAISVRYLGDSEPISDNDTEVGRAGNRRVEIRILL